MIRNIMLIAIGFIFGILVNKYMQSSKTEEGAQEPAPAEIEYVKIVEVSDTAEIDDLNDEKIEGIDYFDSPKSYESKKTAYFKVSKVRGNTAEAEELSLDHGDIKIYGGKSVLLIGKDFYDGQEIEVKEPMIIGTYRDYSSTLPVIKPKSHRHPQ